MILGEIFARFAQESPLSVIVRGILERELSPDRMDNIFQWWSGVQYQRELLFSKVVELMSQVVSGIRPSIHAAYQAQAAVVGVSVTSVYNKLQGLNEDLNESLVRETARSMGQLIEQLGGRLPDLVPGYTVSILDGNCLAATEHRLAILRPTSAGALPGKTLVVFDPSLKLVTDVVVCADGHAQERSLLAWVSLRARPKSLWVMDRNFCTQGFLGKMVAQRVCFIVRQHQHLPWQALAPLRWVGRSETGEVWEQPVQLTDGQGQVFAARRIVVRLGQPTRDGEWEIALLSNLPEAVSALTIAHVYRQRWGIETAFQVLTENLGCEVNTLGYPNAALFAFCVALMTYNLLAVVKATLRAVHGHEKIATQFSDFYLADEIKGTYRGMMIAIPPPHWQVFADMTEPQFVDTLKQLAAQVNLATYRKHPRQPKRPPPKKTFNPQQPHVSTAKLLAQAKAAKLANPPP